MHCFLIDRIETPIGEMVLVARDGVLLLLEFADAEGRVERELKARFNDYALQPATDAYVNRIRELDASTPDLLLAHAYVRYLGDLSGGQMLRGIVAASMPVPEGRGTAFYEFGDAEQTHALTQAFRNGLARVVADPATVSALAAEARCAFELHSRLFDELARAFKLGDEPAVEPVVAVG